jgi:hypothetical protein
MTQKTEHEQPQAGGSYIRGKDGKLTRVDDSAPPAAADAAAEEKPAARSGASLKKEK